MDLQTFTQWAGAVGLVLGIVNMFWNMAGRAAKPVTEKLTALDTKLNQYRGDLVEHDRRIQKVEGEMVHVPSGKEVGDLRVAIERLDGHVKGLEKTFEPLARTVARIDDFLRENRA